MVRHIFLYKVKDGADPKEILRILNELPKKVPGIRTWTLDKHQGEEGNSGGLWHYGLVCDFDSFEALQTYSDHPFHQEVVEKLTPMFADRAVCDYEFTDATVK